jgi:PAS domain S-box-containing protein
MHAMQSTLFTSARFAVMVANHEGIIQSFNVGAERMLGYSSAEVVNKFHLVEFHDPQELSARTRALSREFATAIASGFETLTYKAARGIEDCFELAYLCKDGSRLPTSISVSSLRDDRGVNIGYLLVGADDSPRRQLELKLNKASSDAHDLELARANRLANVCHELRTPLNAILGFAQLMASGPTSLTGSQKRNIELILEAGWYQQKLISDVLDLALLESGEMSLSMEPLALAEIMLECQHVTQPLAQTRGVKLIFPTMVSSPFVKADRIRLPQVFTSLLLHAIDSSKTGGSVVVDYEARNPKCIRFCIRGSDGLDATAGQGEAVGMTLTRRLVELMGGFIGVGDDVGTDRVLWFELERIVRPATTANPLTNRSRKQAGSSSRKRLSPVLSTSK